MIYKNKIDYATKKLKNVNNSIINEGLEMFNYSTISCNLINNSSFAVKSSKLPLMTVSSFCVFHIYMWWAEYTLSNLSQTKAQI